MNNTEDVFEYARGTDDAHPQKQYHDLLVDVSCQHQEKP